MKERVIELLFAFFEAYMTPRDAVIATLGGWGLEASMWQKKDIQKDNGWLIERSLSRRKNLIRNFPFHYVNQLRSFPRLFQSVKGEGTGVDFFHLDLCGTFEGSYGLVEEVLPLVLASTGKCLAITVADQRRNTSHENFKTVFIEGKKLFGKHVAEELLRQLKTEGKALASNFDGEIHIEGIARREFGFFVHVAKVLGNTRIERMERYVYHSEVGSRKTSFRMRTYMFRLGEGELDPTKWVHTPIRLVLPETEKTIVINNSPTEKKGKQKVHLTFNQKSYPALAGMLVHASAEVRSDFDRLMGAVNSSGELGKDLLEVLSKHGFGVRKMRPQKDTEASVPGPFPGEAWGTTKKEVAVKIYLLGAEASSSDFEDVYKIAGKYLGINGTRNRNNTLGAHLARTKGDKFRPTFIKSILESTPKEQHDAVLEVIAGYYKALDIAKDPRKLLQEATDAGYAAIISKKD